MKKSKVLYASVLALLVIFASAMVVAFALLSGREGEDPQASMSYYDIAAGLAYALLIAALVLAVAFPVLRMVQNFNTYLRTLIGLAVVAVVFFLSYAFSPESSGELYTSHNIGPYMSRFINAGLITTYITLLVAVLIFVYSEISERVK